MCLYPRLILNPKYRPNKKNGGQPPKPNDKRVMMVPIGCGHCIECRKQKANEWKVRLSEELLTDKNAWYITLTFNEEKLQKYKELYAEKNEGVEPTENDTATIAVRYFLERWRKNKSKSPKHWLITEKGHEGTERIHLHGLIWTDKETIKELPNIWGNGWTRTGTYVNGKTINYIIKYITKVDNDHPEFEGKILASAGLGNGYFKREKLLNTYNGTETKDYYKLPNGKATSLPIYYRNKIYTEEQREKLWLQKMDEKKIYVLGKPHKIDTEEGVKEYLNALKTAQKDNKKNGYSGIHWKSDIYKDSLKNAGNNWD